MTSGLTKIAYPVFELTDPEKVDRPEDLLNRQDLQDLLDHLSGGSQRILRPLPTSLEQPQKRYEIFHDVLAKPILEWRRRYRQNVEMETERRRHAEELQLERQRRRRNLWISAGLGLPLLAYSSYLLRANQQLNARQKELTVIESAQQFKVQQLDQIDALVQALDAAHWLKQKGTERSPGAAREIGANLRHILDHMQERFKAELLTAKERQINPPWLSKIHPKTGEVAFLFRNGSLEIRDLQGRSRRLTPAAQAQGQGPIKAFALADSDGRVATLSKDAGKDEGWLLQVWQASGELLWSEAKAFSGTGPLGPFLMRNRLAFSSDGRRLATASFDGWLRISNLPSIASPPQPPPAPKRIPDLALVRFSRDGQRIAAADRNGKVHLINPTTGLELKGVGPIQLPQGAGFIFVLDFAPDGQSMAIASRDGKLRLYDLQGRLLDMINTGRIFQLRFSPDGRLLAIGSRDGSAEVLDLKAPPGQQSLARFLNQAAVVDLQFSADGRELSTISAAGMLHQWEVPEPLKSSRSGPGQQLSALTFNPGSNALAWAKVGSESACLLPLAEARPSSGVAVPLPSVPCGLALRPPSSLENSGPTDLARLKFNAEGSTLAGLAWDGTGAVWDRNGRRLGSLLFPKKPAVFAPFSSLSFNPDGRRFAFVARGDTQGELLLCNQGRLKNGSLPCSVAKKITASNEAALDLTSVHFLHQTKGVGQELVVSVADGRLCFADLQASETLKVSRCFAIPTGQGELAVSPDDAWIGLAGIDGFLYYWERNGNTIPPQARKIKVSAGPLIRATFRPSHDPKRRFLAAVSLDGTASLWTLNGQQLATFRTEGGERGGYLGAEFERGGDLLLWTLNGSLHQEAVQDLSMLIDRGCNWLKTYREGALTPPEAKAKLRFCKTSTGALTPAQR